ncbi:MAG: hypothetical protein KAJ67_04575 [Gemmatimonadetes bacterium]|nr:hypothetical protein [Gemmatimonadota bacterium]
MSRLKQLIQEIHRRSLWQVLVIYMGGSWITLQLVDTLAGALNLPDWAPPLALFLLIIGFPIVLATAFVQEDGRRAKSEAAEATHASTGAAARLERPRVARNQEPSVLAAHSALRRILTWRNAIVGGVLAFALWGIVAAGWLLLGARGAGSEDTSLPAASPTLVAVFPFSVRASDELGYLAEGLVSLMSTKLDGAGDLRSVDPRRIISAAPPEDGTLDPSRVRALAERLGAGRYVVGDVVEAGGRIQITAALFDQSEELEPVALASVEGDVAELFSLLDALAAQLLRASGGPGARVRRIAAVTTASLTALKSYLAGEQAYRVAQFELALASFQLAIEEDSSFALAHYRLSLAAEWLSRPELSFDAAMAAHRHAARLSERDRRLLEAFLAWRRGEVQRAEDLYRAHVGAYSDDVEGWFQLGEVLFHANALRGRSVMDARAAFAEVLTLEPDDSNAALHMARIAAGEGNVGELDSLVEAHVRINPEGDRALELLALQAFFQRDARREQEILSRLEHANDLTLAVSAWSVALFTGNLDGAAQLASLLAAPSRPRELRALGRAWLAHLRLAGGQWVAARVELAALEDLDQVLALEARAQLAALGIVPTDPEELTALRAALESLDAEAVPNSESPNTFFSAHNGLHPTLRAYLLGLLSVRQGDVAAALRYAAQLETMASPPGAEALTSDLARGVRALALRSDGRVSEALEMLEATRIEAWYQLAMASPFYSQAAQRFLRAELLREAGRPVEALEWYSNLTRTSPWELAFLPFALYGQAQAYEQLGDWGRAAEYYARFVELWKGADPELQPRVDAAQQRLAEILAERS